MLCNICRTKKSNRQNQHVEYKVDAGGDGNLVPSNGFKFLFPKNNDRIVQL